MKRLLAGAAVPLLALGLSQLAGHADTVNAWLVPYQRSVYMTGDSLTWGTAPYLQFLFDLSARDLQVRAFPGVTIAQALPWTQQEASAAAAPMPPTAVVALGQNDRESPAQLMWWMEGMIDTFSPTERIVWVNFYNRVDTTWEAKNAVLTFVASLHSNVTILDWASVISQRPEDILPDGVHYTAAGYALRAVTIGAAVS